MAGLFYPGHPDHLAEVVDALVEEAGPTEAPAHRPKALVVPHAGYVYSGPVAASAYRGLRGVTPPYRKVVLLGPAHRAHVRGMATSGAGAFATPLGEVPVDAESTEGLASLEVRVDAHEREHSLEVQLPFLQRLLGPVSIIPIVVGDAPPREVATLLEALWGGPETLVVISTDLSHYLPYDEGRRVDAATVQRILDGGGREIDHEEACGATPLNGFLRVARDRGMIGELCDLRSSGDTAGGKGEVVGYAALTYRERDEPANGRAHA